MLTVFYPLVAAYALKLALTRETYERDSSNRTRELVIAAIATLYPIFMLYAGGLDKLLLSGLILAPGKVLFFVARREQNRKVVTFGELVIFTVAAIAALFAIYGLSTGLIIL